MHDPALRQVGSAYQKTTISVCSSWEAYQAADLIRFIVSDGTFAAI